LAVGDGFADFVVGNHQGFGERSTGAGDLPLAPGSQLPRRRGVVAVYVDDQNKRSFDSSN